MDAVAREEGRDDNVDSTYKAVRTRTEFTMQGLAFARNMLSRLSSICNPFSARDINSLICGSISSVRSALYLRTVASSIRRKTWARFRYGLSGRQTYGKTYPLVLQYFCDAGQVVRALPDHLLRFTCLRSYSGRLQCNVVTNTPLHTRLPLQGHTPAGTGCTQHCPNGIARERL